MRAAKGPDQGLHCPLTELLDNTKCMNGEQRPYFDQDDLGVHILLMFEGIFAFDVAHI